MGIDEGVMVFNLCMNEFDQEEHERIKANI